ncbi:hypothetical protein ACEI36_07940 [Pseudomonas kielensis]
MRAQPRDHVTCERPEATECDPAMLAHDAFQTVINTVMLVISTW